MNTYSLRPHTDPKVIALIWFLRLVSVGYAVWTLISMNRWWSDSPRVTQYLGLALGRDLSAHQAWQRLAPWTLDWLIWGVMALAVWRGWVMLGRVLRGQTFTPETADLLRQVGGFGLVAQSLAMLSRPLYSWLMTYHLTASERVLSWRIHEPDLLVLMLCGVLICTAIIVKRGTLLAQENAEFV